MLELSGCWNPQDFRAFRHCHGGMEIYVGALWVAEILGISEHLGTVTVAWTPPAYSESIRAGALWVVESYGFPSI